MSRLFRKKGSRFVWITFSDQYGIRHRRSMMIPYDVRGGRWIVPNSAKELQRQIDHQVVMKIWGIAPRQKSLLISEVLEQYLATAGSNLRPNSRRCKTLAVRELIRFLGDVPIASVERGQLFDWKAFILKKKISVHTAASWIREISPLFRWAVENDVLERSPITRGFKMNPPVAPPEIFTAEDFSQVLDLARARPHVYHALEFLWETGFRVGEMTELRWSRPTTSSEFWGWMDFEGNTIWVWNQKERRYDAYPMKGVREMLEELPRGEWVFSAARGGKIDPVRLNRDLKKIIRALDLNPALSVHSIRKSYCSRLIRQGVDFGTVHKLMRHRDPATTMRYYAQFQLSTLEEGQRKGSTRSTIPAQ